MIDQTILVWEPRYRRRLSREEARQILVNALAFFQTLAALDLRGQRVDPPAQSERDCEDETAA